MDDGDAVSGDSPRRGVHGLVEEQVARTPDAIAVSSGTATLTYADLDARATRLARHLRTLGVGPDVPVGLCVHRSPRLLVGILGILKAGGAYVPLDPAYPQERISFIIEDSGSTVILTESGCLALLPPDIRTVCLDDELPCPEPAGGESLPDVGPGTLAYLIYTSGSTGFPKGVMVEHGSVVALIRWSIEEFSADEVAVTIFSTSVCFDMSVFEIFAPLSRGGQIRLVENALALEDPELAAGATLLNTVPSSADELLENRRLPLSLRAINLAGEPLSPALVDALHRRSGPVTIRDLYGPTEATVYSTCGRREAGGPNTIGRPILGTRIYLLDEDRRPTAPGEVGEIFIGGAGVARGYWRRPELTAERFLPDPFASRPESRCYRTGDRARYLPDGSLSYLGRIDHQVKIRGFRIEPGEVEAALSRHPAVARAVVVAREDRPGDQRLVAYFVPRPSVLAPSSVEVRRFLKTVLPSHMVPAAFVSMARLPLTPNGKVDRKSLPEPDDHAPSGPAAAARTTTESLLLGIWSDVLGGRACGIHDNFFESGGHSLLAMRLAARASRCLGRMVPVGMVFEHPTIATLAAALTANRDDAATFTGLERVDPTVISGLPASCSQERLWFVDQLEAARAGSLLCFAWRIRGPLDHEALSRALEQVLRRHETLRTNFFVADGHLVQKISPLDHWDLPQTDLRPLASEQRVREVRERIDRERRQGFDLGRDPALRANLLREGDQEHVLLVTLHHIAVDGWSLPILWRDLAAGYVAACTGSVAQLPEPPARYVDFAVWQRRAIAEGRFASARSAWLQRLSGLQPLHLPTDRPRVVERSAGGGRHRFTLDAVTLQGIRSLGIDAGATLHMTLLASFQAVLARWTGQHDIAVATPVAERRHPELDEVVGLFVNLLVIRASLAGCPTFRGFLEQVRTICLEAYDNDGYPFERLVAELRPAGDRGRLPLVTVAFQFLDVALADLDLGTLTVEPLQAASAASPFELELLLQVEAGRLVGEFVYDRDLFTAATVERLALSWEMLLRGVVADPDGRLDDMPLVTPAERERMLVEWNDTAVDYPRELPLPRIFESVVDRCPDGIALVTGQDGTTYRQLDERANRLAHHLMAFGAAPGVCVGVDLPRSSAFVVAVMAILKTGAAYVPFGREHPPERRRAMVRDTGMPVIVSGAAQAVDWADPAVVIVDVHDDATRMATLPATRPSPRTAATDPAYVMYTSGSTGQPKGVVIPHRAIARLVLGTDFLPWSPDLRFLLLASPAFDASTLELWGPLLHGARLVVYPDEELDLATLGTVLARERISCLWLTAALFNHIIDSSPAILAPIRHLMTGGEPLSPRHVRAAADRFPEMRLINGYGPTETTTFATTHDIRDEAATAADEPIPIGRPIANTRCLVLDAHRQLVPVGVAGELYIGGDGVAVGYLNDAEKTAEKFVRLSSGQDRGDRWYRTGDLVRWRPDGSLDFLGRIDRQVKVRGFRIEPGEVEATLARHPAVVRAALLVREDEPGEKRLVAYVVPTATAPTDAELRDFLATTLPSHMIPTAFVPVTSLPLTPNGKLDHAALPPPARDLVGGARPRGTDEETVAAVFRELLHQPDVDRTADFFACGGDSLQALSAVARIGREAGVTLRVTDLIQRPTVEMLAALIRALRAGTAPAPVPRAESPTAVTHAAFVRRLREIASRHGRRPAMISHSGTISYGVLEVRSNRIARHLLALGMRPGARVRLTADVCSDTLTVMLALLKVGAVVELDDFASPAWTIDERRANPVAQDCGDGPPGNVPPPRQEAAASAERLLVLDELLHAGSVEWRVIPSDAECPPSVAKGRDRAFRGSRRGDLVSYGAIDRLAAKTRPGWPLPDIVGPEATPRRLLRRLLQGRTLVVVGSGRVAAGNVIALPPAKRTGLAACLSGASAVWSVIRSACGTLGPADDDGFVAVKRPGRGGPTIACIGDTRPVADILRLAPPTAEVLSLKLDGLQVWPPLGYSVQDHVDEYVRILGRRLPDRGLLLVGFSHGGALCHALAAGIESGRVTGPRAVSGGHKPGRDRLSRTIRGWLTHDKHDGRPPYAERFERMIDRLDAIRSEHQWKSFPGVVTLLGGRRWLAEHSAAWRRLCRGPFQEIPLDSDDHFAAFHERAAIATWTSALREACAAIDQETTGTVRVLMVEPTPARMG